MGNSSRPFIVLRKASAQWKWIDSGHTSLDVLPYNLHPWAAFDEEKCRRERSDGLCCICQWQASRHANLSADGLLII